MESDPVSKTTRKPWEPNPAIERVRSALGDPIQALGGDTVTLAGTDLLALLREYDLFRATVAGVARPSLDQRAGPLRKMAEDAWRTATNAE